MMKSRVEQLRQPATPYFVEHFDLLSSLQGAAAIGDKEAAEFLPVFHAFLAELVAAYFVNSTDSQH